MPRLRRSDPSAAGIRRRRRGRGWSYQGPSGQQITDPAVLARIEGLVIPPAWRDVWICPYPNGHIQCLGTDAAGRRQYRYHDQWRAQRDAAKFDRVLEVAQLLPLMRDRACADLAVAGLPRQKALACAVRLLDIGFFRIGGEEYAEQNGSFGLATLHRDHVRLEGPQDARVIFDYRAKSGQHRVQAIAQPDVASVVRTLLDRDDPNPALLAWWEEAAPGSGGSWRDVRSRDVNDYLKEIAGGADVTAKDFRTWAATVLAAVALAVSEPSAPSPTARKRAIARMYQEVARYLGNTPAVCRASYVHPRVVDLYQDGVTVAEALDVIGVGASDGEPSTQGEVEAAVLDMLRDPKARRRPRARLSRGPVGADGAARRSG